MRQSRYLNVILTVNAVLLGLLIWTQVTETDGLATEAQAQSRPEVRFPNASSQRQEMVKALNALQKKVDENNKLLKGTLKVEVTNIDEFPTADAAEDPRDR